jgi:purine-binding chemotaxis protein CheW
MSVKKQRAQTQQTPVVTATETENITETTLDEVVQENYIEAATKEVCEVSSDSVIESHVQDSVEQVKQSEHSVETKKVGLVVFRVDKEEFAVRISNIQEIIRIPSIIKFPNAPHYINGLCSLRGELLPVINGRKLFGLPDKELDESCRIIVADIKGKKVGLISDKVLEVINVEEADVKEPPANIKGDNGVIEGILILNNGDRVIMILDTEKMIKLGTINASQQNTAEQTDFVIKTSDDEQIVICNIGSGEYAFDVNYVKEIIRLPDIMKVPNTAGHVEGVFSLRNELLAVINLGKLLGMNHRQPDENSRVVIINNGNTSFGVIVDKVSQIVQLKKELYKANSQAKNSSDFTKGIFNMNDGKRLVMMLEPNKLISLEDLKNALDGDIEAINNTALHTAVEKSMECVVFKLGEEEYGIDIHNVQEINRISTITSFPGAPDFIDGMVDLRGDTVPILNLRKMFGILDLDSYNASKFIVVEHGEKKIGILVDSVSEVLRFSTSSLEEAPNVLKENAQDSYIDKIAKLNDGKRVVLILNLTRLLGFM